MAEKLNQSDLLSMLDCIPVSELSYDEWLNVGMAIHQEGFPCSIWESWSMNDSRFHVGECAKRWETFGKNDGTPVTGATIARMAKARGWAHSASRKTYDWDDFIRFDDSEADNHSADLPGCPNPINPVGQVREYLQTLFLPDEKIAFAISSYKDEDGKYKPKGCICSRSCSELLDSLIKHPDDVTLTLGNYTETAGAWVCINPVDGKGRKDENISAWRYTLLESDTIPVERQWQLIQALRLPVAIAVHSAGKSLHAIVHIDAKNAAEYRDRINKLHQYCTSHGFPVDSSNKNPSRLSRLPGIRRGENWQYIVSGSMGPASWEEWDREVLNPNQIHTIDGHWEKLKPLKPELIYGILRQKHKMQLTGSSKAGKSFSMIHLAVCIAEGKSWMGHECQKERTLYFNMEIDEASFEHRIQKVYEAMELEPGGLLDVITLRGEKDLSIDRLIDIAKNGGQYGAIFIDPFYKLGVKDENAAGEIAEFCGGVDRMIEQTGAAVIYSHHHSKGMQSQKSSMDRGSGSGVFARDADALIDLLELSLPDEYASLVVEKYGPDCIPCKMEYTLREFRRPQPTNCFFSYPLLYADEDGWLDNSRAADQERARAAGRAAGSSANRERQQQNIDELKRKIKRDRDFGKVKSKKAYAEELNISTKQLNRYFDFDPELEVLYFGQNDT